MAKQITMIKCEFKATDGQIIKIEQPTFDRNYDDEETAMIFVTNRQSKEDGYFELNVHKDENGVPTNDGYVCEYPNTDATDPTNIIEGISVAYEYGEVMYCVTYVGLSDSEYKANGYSEVALYATKDAAKAKLKAWRDNEIAELKEQERDYEVLEDEDDECRISWCGHGEQIRIEIHEVDYDNIKQSDENPAKDTTAKRNVWLRMGITLCGDEQDIEQVVSGKDGSEDTLMRLMKESSFVIDGDTYIPQPCIEQYNKDYGTTHEVGDVGFNLYDATEYHIAPAE